MKKLSILLIFSLLSPAAYGGVIRNDELVVKGPLAVGTTSQANSKAVLDVVSTSKGMLPPRMTTTQRDAISSPPEGLTVYNTTTHRPNRYDGTAWREIPSLDGTETLTNKTLDAALNTFSNIANSMIATGAAIARSKLATGTTGHVVINDGSTGAFSSEATLAKSRGGTGADNSSVTFPASGVVVTEAATETLTNKSISGSSNTVTNLSDSAISSSAAIARSKIASGTNYRILANNSSGAMSENAALTANGAVTADANGQLTTVAPGSNGNVLTSNGTSWTSAAPASGSGKATGEVFMFGGTTCPAGSLEADGTSKLRSGGTDCGGGSCANLFAAISTAWGTADGTHFNMPDLRGKFVRGYDHAATNDPDRASRTACKTGGATGDNVGSCQADATKKNGLALSDPGHSHTYTLPSAGASQGGNDSSYFRLSSGATTSTSTTGITLGNGDNETRPKNVSILYCVQY